MTADVHRTPRGLSSVWIPLSMLTGALVGLLLTPDWGSFSIWSVLMLQLAALTWALRHLYMQRGGWRPVVRDARFYLFCLLGVYGGVVPALAVVDAVPVAQLRLVSHVQVAADSEIDIIWSQLGSLLLFAGTVLGSFMRWGRERIPGAVAPTPSIEHRAATAPPVAATLSQLGGLTAFWIGISAISTGVFIYPFAAGGFVRLQAGGSITEIESFGSLADGSTVMTLIGFLFSAEVMTASTLVLMGVLYLRYTRGGSTLPIVLLIIAHVILALITTRTIRAVILILGFCVIAALPGPKKGRGPMRAMMVAIPVLVFGLGALNLAPSLLIVSGGDFDAPATLPELLRSTDVVGPYDAYLRSLDEKPDISMGLNVPVSLVSAVPVIGSPLLELLGLEAERPLARWLALEYPAIYRSGGGLAAMPQLEGYLTAGMIGVFATGLVFGVLARMSRTVLGSLFMVAVSVLFARGSLGIVAQLAIPYGLVTALIFGTLISSLLRIPTLRMLGVALEHRVVSPLWEQRTRDQSDKPSTSVSAEMVSAIARTKPTATSGWMASSNSGSVRSSGRSLR